MGKLVKLNPFISEKVWGGPRLNALKNLASDKRIGETWEVSTHIDGPSKLDKTDLSTICSLRYLVKFIDTTDNLSIQVHPDDQYAKLHENSSGKAECWIILECDVGAGIYLGFKKGVTKKEFFNALETGVAIDRFLNFIPVKAGDCFFLPPGSVHAIGKGVTLCEVQQSSGITYRVWDWNRMGLDGKPRELHILKAKDVLNFNDEFNLKLTKPLKSDLFKNAGVEKLIKHKDFEAQFINYPSGKEFELNLKPKDSIIVLSGKLDFINSFESAFSIEAGVVNLKTSGQTSFLIVSEPAI